jgi:hypothetical protein
MAVLEMVQIISEKRFLAERLGQSNPSDEEEVGNYESYTISPDQKTVSLTNQPFQMGAVRESTYGSKTVTIAATHPSMTTDNQELFFHNLNGFKSAMTLDETLKTSADLTAHNKIRPFLMSDNTFPGAGKFTGSWLTNFGRTWTDLRNSIAGVMNLNMFGVALAGTEVCGSLGKFDAELCARWTQNSVLFPAVRNYYNATFWNETSMKQETNPAGELFQMDIDTEFEWIVAANGANKQRYTLL